MATVRGEGGVGTGVAVNGGGGVAVAGVSIGGSDTYGDRGGGGNGGSGLSKLREEVQKCGYKDVQVMWNILTASPHLRPKPTKRRSYWKLLFWSNHKLTPSSFSSFS
ncbi:hypothetical protein ACSBR1_026116 [Camellia fascicularis]